MQQTHVAGVGAERVEINVEHDVGTMLVKTRSAEERARRVAAELATHAAAADTAQASAELRRVESDLAALRSVPTGARARRNQTRATSGDGDVDVGSGGAGAASQRLRARMAEARKKDTRKPRW